LAAGTASRPVSHQSRTLHAVHRGARAVQT